VALWYIFPFWNVWTKKNLATLVRGKSFAAILTRSDNFGRRVFDDFIETPLTRLFCARASTLVTFVSTYVGKLNLVDIKNLNHAAHLYIINAQKAEIKFKRKYNF
jgi:hypothetical protein